MGIKQLKTYVVTCDGDTYDEEWGYEDCSSSVVVQAEGKYEALRSLPDGWYQLGHSETHIRCPKEHSW